MQLPLNTPHSQPHSITWDFSHMKDSKMRNKLSEYKELFDPSRQLLGQYNRHFRPEQVKVQDYKRTLIESFYLSSPVFKLSDL